MRRIPAAALRAQAAEAARRARRQLALLVPLLAIVALAHAYRSELFGLDAPVRLATALVLVVLGGRLAREVLEAVAGFVSRSSHRQGGGLRVAATGRVDEGDRGQR